MSETFNKAVVAVDAIVSESQPIYDCDSAEIVTAVLRAIRAPSLSVCDAGQEAQDGFWSGPGDSETAFNAMIDAIIREKSQALQD